MELKRIYGMSSQGQNKVQALLTPISGTVGSYTGIASVGGVFPTSGSKTKVSIVGSMLNITIDAFPSNVCQYSGLINQDGRSLSGETFQCSDFRTGA